MPIGNNYHLINLGFEAVNGMVNKPLAKKGLQAFIKAAHSLSTSACQNNACDLAHVLILGRKGTGMLAGPPGMGAALKVSVVGACSGSVIR